MSKRSSQATSTGGEDDRALVEAARGGDRDAFRQLFERHQKRAFMVARNVVRNDDDALDVVQDAFIKAFRYLGGFQGNASFSTWLHKIVVNLAIDHCRKAKRGRAVEFQDETLRPEEDSLGEGDLLPRILGGNPARALQDRQTLDRIDAALGALSPTHRAVLLMRELDGMSYEEMAETLGCAKGTIMSRLFHARKNMQRQLIDLVDHPSPELLAELDGQGSRRRARAEPEPEPAPELAAASTPARQRR